MYEMSCQSRFDERYWMLGAGALGRPRGMEWGGRREEGSGWGTQVYLWRIHFDIWQNQYNDIKFKNKIKFKKKKKKRQRNQRSNCQHPLDHGKSKRVPKTSISVLLTMPKPLTVWITSNKHANMYLLM